MQEHKTKQKKMIVIGVILVFFASFAIYAIFHLFIIYTQQENTMIPAYKNGARVVVLSTPLSQFFIHRGSVVLFKKPMQPYSLTIMRIIGLPNEKILVGSGSISINGNRLNESSYLPHSILTYAEPYLDEGLPRIIPRSMYAVMGDNRQFSLDSRTWGFVPKKNIQGVALFCLRNCH